MSSEREECDLERRKTSDTHQLAAWTGIIGPVLFITVFTVEGYFRAGYDPISTYISDLSIGPRGIIQITNFIIFGFLFFIFSYGLTLEFQRSKLSLTGPKLLSLMAALLILSGPFVTDPINTPLAEMTWHGIIHNIFGAAFFLLCPISCYVFWRTFRERSDWPFLQTPTMVITVVLTIVLVVFSVAQKGAALTPNALTYYAGFIQRIDLITFLLWLVAFAWSYRVRLIASSDMMTE